MTWICLEMVAIPCTWQLEKGGNTSSPQSTICAHAAAASGYVRTGLENLDLTSEISACSEDISGDLPLPWLLEMGSPKSSGHEWPWLSIETTMVATGDTPWLKKPIETSISLPKDCHLTFWGVIGRFSVQRCSLMASSNRCHAKCHAFQPKDIASLCSVGDFRLRLSSLRFARIKAAAQTLRSQHVSLWPAYYHDSDQTVVRTHC